MDVTEEEEDLGPEPIVPGVARALSPLVRRILALNPGPFTGLGTNTYLIGIDEIVVVDPGPEEASHLDAVAGCGGDRIRWITTTRSGPEYDGGMDAMLERTGAQRLDPADRETILGTEFRIVAHDLGGPEPGHRTFLLEEERMLFCGGLMADERPAPLKPGVSDLGAVLASIERMPKMRLRRIAPVHGYIIEEAKKRVPAELELREAINDNVLKALKDGASTPAEVVAAAYPKTSDAEVPVMIDTVHVHLEYLATEKKVKASGDAWQPI